MISDRSVRLLQVSLGASVLFRAWLYLVLRPGKPDYKALALLRRLESECHKDWTRAIQGRIRQ